MYARDGRYMRKLLRSNGFHTLTSRRKTDRAGKNTPYPSRGTHGMTLTHSSRLEVVFGWCCRARYIYREPNSQDLELDLE